jgi:predicted nuclease of predicted toxin-antitoxin system
VRLKLDENPGDRGADILRQAGHDVSSVRAQGLSGAPDSQVIEVCRRETRCLVTLDRGFGHTLVFDPSRYPGIAILRLPSRPTPDDLYAAIRTLISGLERRSIQGRLWTVQRGRIREYDPRGEEG